VKNYKLVFPLISVTIRLGEMTAEQITCIFYRSPDMAEMFVSGLFCLNNIPAIASKIGGTLFCIRIFPLRKSTILHIIEAWYKMQNNRRMMWIKYTEGAWINGRK
jgi:hypothetical protein